MQKRMRQLQRSSSCAVQELPYTAWKDPAKCTFVQGTHDAARPFTTGRLPVGGTCKVACQRCGPDDGDSNPYCASPYNSLATPGTVDIGIYAYNGVTDQTVLCAAQASSGAAKLVNAGTKGTVSSCEPSTLHPSFYLHGDIHHSRTQPPRGTASTLNTNTRGCMHAARTH